MHKFNKTSLIFLSLWAFFFIMPFSYLQAAKGNISGQVQDAFSSNPIPDAAITILQNNIVISTTATDINGNYTVANLNTGIYIVRASAINFQTALLGATVLANTTTPIDFQLQGQPGSLIGTVRDAVTNNTLSGALINVFQNDILIDSTTTDINGNYSFLSLPEGSFTVNASYVNFQTIILGVSISPNQTSTINFFLPIDAGTIAGKVINNTNSNPVEGAIVNILQGSVTVAFGNTDLNGNYSIPGIPTGTYTVRASAIGFQTSAIGAIAQTNVTTIVNFSLFQQPSSISGLITNSSTSLPIPGVFVDVFQNSLLIGSTITGVNGSYTLSSLASGNYIVVAHKTNFQTSTQAAIVQFNQTLPIDFSLTADPGTLTGQVIDASSSVPIVGATVNVFQGTVLIASTITDSNGSYIINTLPQGNYTVIGSATNFQNVVVGAIIFSNQTTTLNLSLISSPGTISGQVINANTSLPIIGATVNVTKGIILIASTQTDFLGNYTVQNLAPGIYVATASANLFSTSTQGGIVQSNITTTDNFALQENPGQIIGHVTNADTNTSLAGVSINLLQGTQLIASTLTDSVGNYLLPNLAPGNYAINADLLGFEIVTQGAIVQSNQTTVNNFPLHSQPGTIIGHVSSADTNAPVPGATIDVLKGAILITSVITDSNGNYIIPSISQGGYSVRATAQGFQTTIIGASVQSNQTTIVNFSLQTQPGIIIGQLISQLTMIQISGAIVDVLQGNVLIASTFTDSNGDYNIPVLASGNYIVRAGALNFQIVIQMANVQSSQTTVVNFSLPTDPGTIVGHVVDSVTTLPIIGGIVDVFNGEVLIASTLTESNGDFIIPSLAPGNYTVLVSALNYQIASQLVLVQSNQTSMLNFLLLTEVPLSPSGISGEVLCVEFLTQRDRIHRIKWTPSPSPDTVKYYVFQDGVQIASIRADKPLILDNHNRNKKKSIVYSIKAVNLLGNESEPVSIILK